MEEILSKQLPKIVTEALPGPKAMQWIQRRQETMPPAIACVYPCVMERAQGAIIEDVDGNRFLDWIAGVGVLNVGHNHPRVVEAVKKQADRYFHGMVNLVTHEGYVTLSEQLSTIAPVRGEQKMTFFANSGAEADENAIKVAKAYTKRPNIIVYSGAFHGRTLLTMTMTAKKAYSKGLGPFPDGVYRAEFPYLYRAPGNMSREEAMRLLVALHWRYWRYYRKSSCHKEHWKLDRFAGNVLNLGKSSTSGLVMYEESEQ